MSPNELALPFAAAHPALGESRALQQRVDRKFLLAEHRLETLLRRLQPSFAALTAGQHLWARYENVYFDTTTRALFHAHRRDLRPRFKIRIRRHLDRQLAFLEIKRKDANDRTSKQRLPLPMTQSELHDRELDFIATHTRLHPTCVTPVMEISFMRLTLVGKEVMERLTLDRALTFTHDGRSERIRGVVIAEIKQEQFVNHSGSVAAFRAIRARDASFSKYCIGTSLLCPVPSNVFKPSIRAMTQLIA